MPSTPDDFSEGFFGAVGDAARDAGPHDRGAAADERAGWRHGTTVGINAVVTRTGARVGLLATAGHADALRILDNTGRVTGATVEEILHYARSTARADFVAPRLTREVVERIDFAGDVVVALDEERAEEAVRSLLEAGVESIAVALLWSFANPAHEQRLEAIVSRLAPGVFVTASHRVAPRIGEYPRTATTVFNAYIGPLMRGYIDNDRRPRRRPRLPRAGAVRDVLGRPRARRRRPRLPAADAEVGPGRAASSRRRCSASRPARATSSPPTWAGRRSTSASSPAAARRPATAA